MDLFVHQPPSPFGSNINQKNTEQQSTDDDIKCVIAHHCTMIQSMSKSYSSKILSFGQPLSALANATLRTTMMAITNATSKKLFLSMDHNWNGQGFISTFPTLYVAQANDYVEYLPVYLAHLHSKEVYHWFTPDAIMEAKVMGWDTKKQPISKDGLDLWTSIQLLDLEWCIAPPSGTPQMMVVIDLDNIMLPSFNTVTQPIFTQPGTPSVVPNLIPQPVQQSATDHHNGIGSRHMLVCS